MGQKVDPRAMRLGINRSHDSNWYANKKDFRNFLAEDFQLRSHIEKNYRNADIDRIIINRFSADKVDITIYSHKVGLLFGRKGGEIDTLKKNLGKLTTKQISIQVKEIPADKLSAKSLGLGIANAIEKRTPFKKAMNGALNRAKKSNALGMKVAISGRLNGAEIARTESAMHGKVPLHSLDYDIDFAIVEAQTVMGIIGIKIWLCHGIKKEVSHVNA